MTDNVNHPAHYNRGLDFECIDIAEHCDYCTGNFIKYLWRYPYKGKPVEDLEKALWYAKRAHEHNTWPSIEEYPNAETIHALADTAKYGMEAEVWRQLFTGAPWGWVIEYLEKLLKEVKEHETQNGLQADRPLYRAWLWRWRHQSSSQSKQRACGEYPKAIRRIARCNTCCTLSTRRRHKNGTIERR